MATTKESAWTLLRRHAGGERLPASDEQAMLRALDEFCRRDRTARKWANVRDGQDILHSRVHPAAFVTIEDTVQDLIGDVMQRRWPVLGEGRGKVSTITPELMARELNNRLLQEHTKAKRAAERFESIDENSHAGAAAPYGEGSSDDGAAEAGALPRPSGSAPAGAADPFGDDCADDIGAPAPDAPDCIQELDHHRDMETFAGRCLVEARVTVAALGADAQQVVDIYLAPKYLDEQPIDGKDAAHILGVSAAAFTRRLQALGVTLTRQMLAADRTTVLAHMKRTPIGSYLNRCGVRPGQPERWQIAMETLCACNSEHLQALKAQPNV